MPYSAPLDGIRALAILAVLVFHVSPAALQGGFTGVDVFFVLSGFLITSIILHDLQSGTFSLKEFYLRRIQRLLPNAALTILTVVVVWEIFLPHSTAARTGRHAIWALFNLSNIYTWRYLGGYWGNSATFAPLVHTWSLAIEEQFYLCFPATLLLLARFQRRRIGFWLAAATALSFGLCLYGTRAHPTSTFYLLPTRGWELLIGSTLASIVRPLTDAGGGKPALKWPRWLLETFSLVGLLAILAGYGLAREVIFPGLVALLPTLGTALVIFSVTKGRTLLSRVLSGRLLVLTGRASYSLYLWHWPLIILGRIEADFLGLPALAGAVLGAFLSVIVAGLVYYLVEQPLRGRGAGRAMRLSVIGAGFATAALAAVLVARHPGDTDPDHLFDPPTFHGFAYSVGKVDDPELMHTFEGFRDVVFSPLPRRAEDPWRSGGIVHPYGGGSPRVVVLGSSHALMYARLIDDLCKELGVSVAFLAADQTPVFFSATVNPPFPTAADAQGFDEARKRYLREWHPAVVFAIDRWDARVADSDDFARDLRSFLAVVSPLTDRVVLVSQVPVVSVGAYSNLREFVSWRRARGDRSVRLNVNATEWQRQEAIRSTAVVAKEFANVEIVRPDLLFANPDRSIRWGDGRAFYYTDDNHLSDAGADLSRDIFRETIGSALSLKGGEGARGRGSFDPEHEPHSSPGLRPVGVGDPAAAAGKIANPPPL